MFLNSSVGTPLICIFIYIYIYLNFTKTDAIFIWENIDFRSHFLNKIYRKPITYILPVPSIANVICRCLLCSIYWYRWNCLPSLFKLSFHSTSTFWILIFVKILFFGPHLIKIHQTLLCQYIQLTRRPMLFLFGKTPLRFRNFSVYLTINVDIKFNLKVLSVRNYRNEKIYQDDFI